MLHAYSFCLRRRSPDEANFFGNCGDGFVARNRRVGSRPAGQGVYRRRRSAPPVIYDWTGFYVGGNVGYSWGRERDDGA